MPVPRSLMLLLAAAPASPGAPEAVAHATAHLIAGSAVRVLLTEEGLSWASDERLAVLRSRADVAICSRSARDAGWRLDDAPVGIRWSSLAAWMLEQDPAAPLWAVLP